MLILQKLSQGYILLYFYKLRRALSLTKILVEFSLKPVYSTMVGKKIQNYDVHISRKCIESIHFTHAPPPPQSNLFPKFLQKI